MDYIHIKNIEKYHPGYKDRSLIWSKTYFSMLNSDPEFEMLCEIDKWRFVALTMLELQTKKPVPINDEYLIRKGIDVKNRPILLTIQMLHNFIEVRNETVTQSRVEYIQQSRVDIETTTATPSCLKCLGKGIVKEGGFEYECSCLEKTDAVHTKTT